jgi:hypothetical protein
VLFSGGGAAATGAGFGEASAAGAGACCGASLDAGAGAGSGAGAAFAAWSGLISILACWAKVSEVGGTIPPKRWNAADSAGLAAATGAADAGAWEASAMGDRDAGGFSGCWKATSMM